MIICSMRCQGMCRSVDFPKPLILGVMSRKSREFVSYRIRLVGFGGTEVSISGAKHMNR